MSVKCFSSVVPPPPSFLLLHVLYTGLNNHQELFPLPFHIQSHHFIIHFPFLMDGKDCFNMVSLLLFTFQKRSQTVDLRLTTISIYPGLFGIHTRWYETHHLDSLGPSTRKYDDFIGRTIPHISLRQVRVLALNTTRLSPEPFLLHHRLLPILHIDWST